MANCFLVSVVRVFVVVKIDQYRIGSFVSVHSGFKTLDSSVSWCFSEDFVGLDGYAPRSFGALGGTTSCHERSSRHLEFQLSREQVLVNLP